MISSGEPNSATSRRISVGVNGSMNALAADLRVFVSNRATSGKGTDCREAALACHDGRGRDPPWANRDVRRPRNGAFCYSPRRMNPASESSPADELQTLLASRVALVIIESREEGRAIEMVRDAALKAQRGKNWGVFQWTVTEGLMRVDVDMGGAQRTLAQPEQLLRHVKSTTMPGIYVLLDFHPYLENPIFVRTLKDIAQEYSKCARTVVLISHEMKLPQELDHLAARFAMRMPDKKERHGIVMRIAR